MHVKLRLIFVFTVFVSCLVATGWSVASDVKDTGSQSDIDDIESEYIADFELVDVPESPPPDPALEKALKEEKYSNGRMAFLFGQYQAAYDIWFPLADEGYAKAQATLGWMYHTGKGVEKDLDKAFKWYEKAAKQNHAIAQNNLGVFYEQGLGVGKSSSNAARWYREAAEWGYPYAQYNLGTLYLEGRGVKKDDKEAQFWLQIAALQGVDQAVLVLEKLVPNSPAHVRKGDKTISVSKSPHDTPHGSKDYKSIYNQIRSSTSSMDGFDYGSSLAPSSQNSAKSTSTKTASTRKDNSGNKVNKRSSSQNKAISNQTQAKSQGSVPASSSSSSVDSNKKVTIKEMLPGEKFDKWLADAQVARLRLKQLENEKMTNSHTLKIFNDEWVKEQNPEFFTLQLARSDKLDWLLNIAKKQPMFKDTAYYTTMLNGKKWFYLIYGNFENRKSATEEIERLPKALKKWSPWIRQFSEFQSSIVSDTGAASSNKKQ